MIINRAALQAFLQSLLVGSIAGQRPEIVRIGPSRDRDLVLVRRSVSSGRVRMCRRLGSAERRRRSCLSSGSRLVNRRGFGSSESVLAGRTINIQVGLLGLSRCVVRWRGREGGLTMAGTAAALESFGRLEVRSANGGRVGRAGAEWSAGVSSCVTVSVAPKVVAPNVCLHGIVFYLANQP